MGPANSAKIVEDRDIDPGCAGELGPLSQYIGYAVRRAQLAIFRDFIRTLASLNLRPAEFSVLTVIQANPGILQTHLAESVGIQKANLVALIVNLELRKLIKRVPFDGRSNGLFLTRKGGSTLEAARGLHDEHHERVVKLVGEENRAALIAILGRIATLETDSPNERHVDSESPHLSR